MMKIIDNLKGIFVFEICINCNKWVYRNDKARFKILQKIENDWGWRFRRCEETEAATEAQHWQVILAMLMSNNNKKGKKNREIAVAGYFGGEDRIENEESESDDQSGIKQYNV